MQAAQAIGSPRDGCRRAAVANLRARPARGPGLRRLGRRHRARPGDGAGARRARRHRRRLRAPRGAAARDGGGDRGGWRHGESLEALDIRDEEAVDALHRRRARAPRPHRPARQQRRRAVPEPGGGDHAEGLSHRDRAERAGHLADDPRRGDQGLHPAGGRQGAQRHPLAAQRDAGHGPLGRRAGRGREHDADALGRVGAVRDQALRARRRPVRHRDAAHQVPEGGRRERRRARCRSGASAPRRRWRGWSPTSPRRPATSSPAA